MNVNFEIAVTHILSRRRQTIIATLGVAIGITAFVFLNSLILGFTRYFDNSMFKSMPHIRVYREDELSKSLQLSKDTSGLTVVINPKIVNQNKNLDDPLRLIDLIRNQKGIVSAMPWVSASIFYNNGKSQLNGIASGANIIEANAMFDIQSTMVEGDVRDLQTTLNGIIIGSEIAQKLNLKLNDNITIISSVGLVKVMKIVGIFKTSNVLTDKSKSYVNLAVAQQLMKQASNFVTDVYVKVEDPKNVEEYRKNLELISKYKIEDWKQANETFVAASKTRNVMMRSISGAILLVAAFGIYNILNMTIMQKLNDIAILKATGFSGKNVVTIFVGEAFIMGFFGTLVGLLLATVFVNILGSVYIGGDIGYFPVGFEPTISLLGGIIGILVTIGAGFIPARNAAKVDPIEIFRR